MTPQPRTSPEGHRSARGALQGRRARLAARGRPAAPDGRAPDRNDRVALGGVSNTRPIVLAGCGLLNTRPDTRLGALPPTKRGRRTPVEWNSPQASTTKRPASRSG